jgi:hypothetical protein
VSAVTTPTELALLRTRLKGRLTAIRHDRTYLEFTRAKFGTTPMVQMLADGLDRVEAATRAMLTALEVLEEGGDGGP